MSAVIEAIACGKHYPLPLVYLLSVTILVYGFFNNDIGGDAVKNAMTLRQLLGA